MIKSYRIWLYGSAVIITLLMIYKHFDSSIYPISIWNWLNPQRPFGMIEFVVDLGIVCVSLLLILRKIGVSNELRIRTLLLQVIQPLSFRTNSVSGVILIISLAAFIIYLVGIGNELIHGVWYNHINQVGIAAFVFAFVRGAYNIGLTETASRRWLHTPREKRATSRLLEAAWCKTIFWSVFLPVFTQLVGYILIQVDLTRPIPCL